MVLLNQPKLTYFFFFFSDKGQITVYLYDEWLLSFKKANLEILMGLKSQCFTF